MKAVQLGGGDRNICVTARYVKHSDLENRVVEALQRVRLRICQASLSKQCWYMLMKFSYAYPFQSRVLAA